MIFWVLATARGRSAFFAIQDAAADDIQHDGAFTDDLGGAVGGMAATGRVPG